MQKSHLFQTRSVLQLLKLTNIIQYYPIDHSFLAITNEVNAYALVTLDTFSTREMGILEAALSMHVYILLIQF